MRLIRAVTGQKATGGEFETGECGGIEIVQWAIEVMDATTTNH